MRSQMTVRRNSSQRRGARAVGSSTALVALAALLTACSADDSGGQAGDVSSTTVPATSEPVVDTSAPAEAGTTIAADDGFLFSDPEGRFTVLFPFEPIQRTGSSALQDGTEIEILFHMAESDDFAAAVSCLDYAEHGGSGGVDLEGARDGSIRNTGSNLLTSENIEVQGRPAIEYTAAFNSGAATGFMLGRVYADGSVLCQTFTIDVADTLSDASFAFVESFQFTEEL